MSDKDPEKKKNPAFKRKSSKANPRKSVANKRSWSNMKNPNEKHTVFDYFTSGDYGKSSGTYNQSDQDKSHYVSENPKKSMAHVLGRFELTSRSQGLSTSARLTEEFWIEINR